MNLHLVTGYAGAEHVTSSDQGAFHAALLVNGCYVLNEGNKFAASIVSNNLIKVLDGDIIMQGRYIKLDAGEYAEVPIENGTQDYKRNDLIVVRYTKNSITGIETAAIEVIKGTPSLTDAVDPEYTVCDILNGALVADFPLYRISLNGLNVQEPVALFEVLDNFDERLKEVGGKLADHISDDESHMTQTEKTGLADAINQKHSHENKEVLNNTTASYTAEEKAKLKGIAANANAYEHPNSGVAAGTYRSVTVNEKGHVTGGSNPTLPVNQGGTGATDAATARANLGLGNVNNTADSTKSVNYATSAGSATKATNDSSGRNIVNTYKTKAESANIVFTEASTTAPSDATALWAHL